VASAPPIGAMASWKDWARSLTTYMILRHARQRQWITNWPLGENPTLWIRMGGQPHSQHNGIGANFMRCCDPSVILVIAWRAPEMPVPIRGRKYCRRANEVRRC
jgi:hypothetical protein